MRLDFRYANINCAIRAEGERSLEVLRRAQFYFQHFKSAEVGTNYSLDISIVDGVAPRPKLSLFKRENRYVSGLWKSRTVVIPDQAKLVSKYGKKNIAAHFYVQSITESFDLLVDFIHSSCGELLERQGGLRVHSLVIQNQTNHMPVVVFARMNEGKSTFACHLQNGSQFSVYSDELCVLLENEIIPIPLMIALKEKPSDVSTSHVLRKNLNRYLLPLKNAPQPLLSFESSMWFVNTTKPISDAQIKLNLFEKMKYIFYFVKGDGLPQFYEFYLRADSILGLFNLMWNRFSQTCSIMKKNEFAKINLRTKSCKLDLQKSTGDFQISPLKKYYHL